MTGSRVWLVAGMLAPVLASAQPGPDDAEPSHAAPGPAPSAPPSASPRARPPRADTPPAPGSYAGPPGAYGAGAPDPRPGPSPALAAAPRIDIRDRRDPATAGWTSGLVTGGGLMLMVIAGGMDNHDYTNGSGSTNSHGGRDLLAAVGAIAFVVGPTTGHIYAGHTWNAGLGIRLASVGAMTLGVADAVSSNNSGANSGEAVFIMGLIGYGVGTLVEIGLAPGSARDYNRAHGLDLGLSVVPVRDSRNASAPGLGLVGRF